ncbi:hypothetical protein [Streptomyces stelliscabiei]|uniref:Uncharacterized protein n=1 Tax=Streptomyces stelliscabiei TaxID=146820 RepID=A0A8I0P6K4_9ACTN|nr:hypothetical protein [Streptomyces stelliscabiei]KND45319.1 hypothetical protein IQ64_07780 [Streptomyces stelliscabiei]MBE1597121.1 hypothetical protein [Streptomyces stelliscabiei]
MSWATREAFQSEMDEFDAVRLRKEEWNYLDRKLNALYKLQFEGDTSELTRQRVGRIEALQAVLCGDPAALAQEPPARRHRA